MAIPTPSAPRPNTRAAVGSGTGFAGPDPRHLRDQVVVVAVAEVEILESEVERISLLESQEVRALAGIQDVLAVPGELLDVVLDEETEGRSEVGVDRGTDLQIVSDEEQLDRFARYRRAVEEDDLEPFEVVQAELIVARIPRVLDDESRDVAVTNGREQGVGRLIGLGVVPEDTASDVVRPGPEDSREARFRGPRVGAQ